MLKLISKTFWLPFLILLFSCGSQSKKEDFIDKYNIGNYTPIDTASETLLSIKQTVNWKISLEEKNNFHFTGTGKNIVGYWKVEKIKDNQYKLLLQGGGWTIFGRFDGTSMYFDYPYKMFDSLFSQATFTKIHK